VTRIADARREMCLGASADLTFGVVTWVYTVIDSVLISRVTCQSASDLFERFKKRLICP
jgi:hypothetical protein